jgi:CHASE3 domain sensor protein
MNATDLIGVATVTLTLLALYSSALAWLIGQNSRLRNETRQELDSLGASGERSLDKLQTQEAKSRQELSNNVQTAMQSLQHQINQLRDASATKPELAAVEQRLSAGLNEFKAEARTDFARIVQKVDRLPAIEAHIAAVSQMIEKLASGTLMRN